MIRWHDVIITQRSRQEETSAPLAAKGETTDLVRALALQMLDKVVVTVLNRVGEATDAVCRERGYTEDAGLAPA